jgi:hypothetical protein
VHDGHRLDSRRLEDIQAHIRAIEELDRASTTIDELKERLQLLLDGYTCMTRLISSHQAWRARVNGETPLFENVRQLWYPPAEGIKTHGRLNRPGQSVMYVAGSHHTAALELRPKVGQRFTVLVVRLNDKDALPHVMELGIGGKASEFGFKTDFPLLENTPGGRAFLRGNEPKHFAIRSFLAREFMRIVPRGHEDQFKLSIAIAEMLMVSERIDGVIYPSIAGDGTGSGGGTNMALKPSAADRLFVAETCWLAEVLREVESPGAFEVLCVRRARQIEPTGQIVW